MKNSYRKKIKILSCVFAAVLVFAAVGSTFAWFAQTRKVTIKTEDDVKISVDVDNLEIAISFDGDNYSDYTSAQSLDAETSLADITGDGKNLYYPNYLVNVDRAPDIPLAYLDVLSSQTPDKYVISLSIKFRTSAKMDVYLGKNSRIVPIGFDVDENGIHSWNTSDIPQKSKTGNFSLGGIAGAARVAFITTDDMNQETVQNVWVPNPDYVLSAGASPENTTFLISQDKTKREKFENTDYPYGYIDLTSGSVVYHPYVWDDYANRDVTIGREALASVSMAGATVGGAKKLLSFEDSTTPVEKELKIRIWIEGTDREANYYFNGGQMAYFLSFVGITKNECQYDLTNRIACDKTSKKMYYNDGEGYKLCSSYTDRSFSYSFNGIDWSACTDSAIAEVTDTTDIYVRVDETDADYASVPLKIKPTAVTVA